MLKRKQQRQKRGNSSQARPESFLDNPEVEVPRHLRSTGHQPGPVSTTSGIRDNYTRGTVGSFLKEKIHAGSALSIVSAYFTIYAFEALKEQLQIIEGMRFLFGEPRFLKALDPEKTDKKAFKIEDDGLQLANRLEQKCVARACEL